MEFDPLVLGLIGAGVVILIVAILGALWWRRRRWRREFGREYDRVLERSDSRKEAINELKRRKERRGDFEIEPLDSAARERYAQRWEAIQHDFVEEPSRAVRDAHRLITEAMSDRGYPVEDDFEQKAADLSVDHPHVVEHYRAGNHLALEAQKGNPLDKTEDRRQAMLHFRRLFEELVEISEDDIPTQTRDRTRRSA